MASGTCGKNLVWNLDNGTLTIGGFGEMENYEYYDKTPWISYSSSIQKIIIGESVTSIGDVAFCCCDSLREIKIPDSVKEIGNDAFSCCKSLKEITILDGVTKIGKMAFRCCKSLREIKLPDSVIEIGNKAFSGCDSLREIKIPDGVTKIGDEAFCGCTSLKEITIPDSVTSIGGYAFNSCKNLREIKIPYGITEIRRSTFWACENLTEITIPDSVTKIGNCVFRNCTSLKEITIPASVTFIGNAAFIHCKSLKEITIPESMTEIGDKIFDGCTSLRKIYYRAGSGFEAKLAYGNNAELIPVAPQNVKWRVDNLTLTVGGAYKIKDYSSETPPWHDYLKTVQRIVIEDGVKEISANAFSNVLRLEHVTIPASVTTIGDTAFTLSYCGERTIDGGKNVIWSLERGILVIKKNPAAKSDADFSTGYESWNVVEKNFKAIKIECGIIPSKSFFEWLWQSGRDVQIKFV